MQPHPVHTQGATYMNLLTVIAFFFHRQEEKQEKTLTYPHKCLPLQANKCKLRILSNSVLIDYGNASKS